MFCNENPIVDNKAETKPIMSKDISVTVAIATPKIMGIKLKYTNCGCRSPNNTLVKITVNKGIVAFTETVLTNKIFNKNKLKNSYKG